MNVRIEKLKEDYERNESKIVSLQAKNKKLAEKIRQLENAEIIGAVRESGLTIDELLSLLGKTEKAPETKNDLEENDNEI
ncbi:MAG: DUF4315 family protein [bacterium]|nr:DUF4315 family protein [bacterium]